MTTQRDFRPTFQVLADDLIAFLSTEPTAIKAVLFRADRASVEQLTDEPDNVGSMEASEKTIDYSDPVPVYAYELPIDFQVSMDTAGEHWTGFEGQPVQMLIGASSVPKGSILLYDEYDSTDDSTVRRIFYVDGAVSATKHPGVAVVYSMLPFIDLEEEFKDAQ